MVISFRCVEVKGDARVSDRRGKDRKSRGQDEMAKDGWEVISTSIYLGGTALTRDSSVMYITFGREV